MVSKDEFREIILQGIDNYKYKKQKEYIGYQKYKKRNWKRCKTIYYAQYY